METTTVTTPIHRRDAMLSDLDLANIGRSWQPAALAIT
jgi:hypothetical protein